MIDLVDIKVDTLIDLKEYINGITMDHCYLCYKKVEHNIFVIRSYEGIMWYRPYKKFQVQITIKSVPEVITFLLHDGLFTGKPPTLQSYLDDVDEYEILTVGDMGERTLRALKYQMEQYYDKWIKVPLKDMPTTGTIHDIVRSEPNKSKYNLAGLSNLEYSLYDVIAHLEDSKKEFLLGNEQLADKALQNNMNRLYECLQTLKCINYNITHRR